MKVSIFRKANWIPNNKDEKIKLAMLASDPNIPEILTIKNEQDLIKIVTSFSWSPSVFNGVRNNNNFVSADLMSLDVDNGLRIEEAEERIKSLGVCCLCLPSPSHTQELHKFRLIFPLERTIFSKKDFDKTWKNLQSLFPEVDEQCSDYARWYCMSTLNDGFFEPGHLFVPEKETVAEKLENTVKTSPKVVVEEDIKETIKSIYGENKSHIPECVEYFIKNAPDGIPGGWINALNSFCLSLTLSGIDSHTIYDIVEQLAPQELDKRDIYQINKSISDGKKELDGRL